MAVQVFEVNDMEWWAGECTPEELLVAYMNETGCTHEESTGDESELPRPLGDSEMNGLNIRIIDEKTDTHTSLTFRQYLSKIVSEGKTFPCIFACRPD